MNDPNCTNLKILHFLSDPQMPIILVAPSNRAICPAKIPQAPAAPETTNVNGLKRISKITKYLSILYFFVNKRKLKI